MDYICTWFYADQKGEESKYAQTGEISSSQRHWDIYLRCVAVFYTISRHFNKLEKHILFTNVCTIPVIRNFDLMQLLNELQVEVVHVDFNRIPPKAYHLAWRNQFFEFSILEYVAENYNENDNFLLLDTDCVFVKPAKNIFDEAKANDGFLSYVIDYEAHSDINGLSRTQMKVLFEDLLNDSNISLPGYHGGEFFLSSVRNIKKIHSDFIVLWPKLLEKNRNGQLKFTEEAHILSYLFYKNGFRGSGANQFIRRIWTNPVFYRNTDGKESELYIWHVPAEKRMGFKTLFKLLADNKFKLDHLSNDLVPLLTKKLGVSNLSKKEVVHYHLSTYIDTFKKRIRNNFHHATRK